MPNGNSNTYGAQTIMSNSIIDLNGTNILIDTESALTIYKLLLEKGSIFRYYADNINDTLMPLHSLDTLKVVSVDKDILSNIAAAKAIGASYHDFMRRKPN